jgi:pimeloyl-ACP methyl ester carboxylesterase
MRGYAPTGPAPDGRYQTGALVADAVALHEVLGGDADAVVIGHDWGAIAAYGAAAFAPSRWQRVVAAAVPPMGVMATGFLDYDQLRRSWYMFFFQSPLADGVVGMDDLRFVDRLWADWSPGYDASADLPRVKEALAAPGSLEAALGYYRAMFDPTRHDPGLAGHDAAVQAPTPQPTLYLHGADDGCVGADLARGAEAFLGAGSRVEVVDGAGHFLHLERPETVNDLILGFIGSGTG